MWLSLLLFVLIISVVVYQATQGLYSAFIMTVLTVCCAGVAFGVYDWVAIHWLATWWKADYAFAVSLGLSFGVPLLVLRVAMDQLLPRACLLPGWVDRIGGGACGMVTGLILVGVIATCLQLIPFDTSILGYARLPVAVRDKQEDGPDPEPPDREAGENELWLKPDRFAVAVASMLSDGVFSGAHSLARDNPDLIQAIGWLNAVPSEVSRYAPPGSISIVETRPVPFVHKYTLAAGRFRNRTPGHYDSEQPKPGHEFQMVRVELKSKARDTRKSHIFTLTQFRLVGRESAGGVLQQRYPIAIQQDDLPEEDDTTDFYVKVKHNKWGDWPVIDEVFMPRADNNNQVEVVFELPAGFEPEYIEYKRGARVSLSFDPQASVDGADTETVEPKPEPDETSSTGPTSTDSPTRGGVPTSGRGGAVRRFTTRSGESRFGDKMPVTLTSYQSYKNVDVSRGALADGHLVGYIDEQEGGTDPAVRRFDVPSDKRLLHLNTEVLKTRSSLGGALSFAVKTLQNFIVTDSQGRQYRVVGKYAIADVEGRQVIEVQYFSHQVGSVGGVGKFEKLKDRHFKKDYQFVLLFLVEPGAEIDNFTTGGAASRRDDLRGENLIAPR